MVAGKGGRGGGPLPPSRDVPGLFVLIHLFWNVEEAYCSAGVGYHHPVVLENQAAMLHSSLGWVWEDGPGKQHRYCVMPCCTSSHSGSLPGCLLGGKH
jgi:hypothetical protein